MKHPNLLILASVFLFQPCQSQDKINYWRGLGYGDSYLEIKDSTLIFNRPDQSLFTSYTIDSISRDSIYCSFYIAEGDDEKYFQNFGHSNNFETITVREQDRNLEIVSLSTPNLHKKHLIHKVTYTIYHEYGGIMQQFELNSSGTITKRDKNLELLNQVQSKTEVNNIFMKLSKVDLVNVVGSEKNFLSISHSPCHCLEIKYNQNSKIQYCRQKHNNYFSDIINHIKQTVND